MTNELVHLEVADQVATITLDSPSNRNALSKRLVAELQAHLTSADADPEVLAVVIAATGTVFCSGADMSEAAGEGMELGARSLVALQRQIVASPKPVVVRLHGAVRAGGLGLVGAADIVVAAETVTFAFTEVRLALAPAVISLTTMPRLDERAAARAFLTGETFGADEAARIGLVTTTVPEARLDDAVAEVLDGLRAAYPQGLRETKQLLNRDLLTRIDALGDEVAAQSAVLFGSDEAKAAMRNFLDRRRR